MLKNNMLLQLIKRYKYIILLVIIICIGGFFRLYQLDSVPPAPSVDEVATGYNAYSILQTGKDEYGKFLPLLLRSYDDYKPALYVYLVIPFVKFFGLSVLAVRLPSAILSTISIFAFYLLMKELFKRYNYVEAVSLISTFFLAINPWHIYISRLGFETNAALSFFIVALLFFFRKNIFSMLFFFGLSFISYQSEKIFIPLYVICLLVLFYKSFLVQWKRFFIGTVMLSLFLLPFLIATFSPGALLRFSGTNIITANENTIEKAAFDQQIIIAHNNHNTLGVILHNRRLFFANLLFQSYSSHFDPKWLFINNNNNGQFKAPNVGLLNIAFSPWYILGIIALVTVPINKKIKIAILLLLFISPLPATITTGAPHAIRSYPLVIVAQIIGGLGFVFTLFLFRNKTVKILLMCLFVTSSLYAMSSFYENYFYAFPLSDSQDFQYAMKLSMIYTKNHKNEYKQVVISNRDNLYQSYMFYLFYSQYPPQKYQKNGGTISGGYAQIHSIDNITFRSINWDKDIYLKHALLLGNQIRISPGIKRAKMFYNLNGNAAIAIVKT